MADDPLIDGGDQRQRRQRCLSGPQRVDERRHPFAVPERLPVNVPDGFLIVGPLVTDHQLNTPVLWVLTCTHGARLARQPVSMRHD